MPKSPRFPPNAPGHASRIIEMLAYPAVQLLDVTGPLQVFATANEQSRRRAALPPYTLRVVASGTAERHRFGRDSGLRHSRCRAPDAVGRYADRRRRPGCRGGRRAIPVLVAWVRRAREAGAARRLGLHRRFLLAASGALDGRRAATHWSCLRRTRAALSRRAGRARSDLRARRFGLDVGRRHRRDRPCAGAGGRGSRPHRGAGGRALSGGVPQASGRAGAVQRGPVAASGRGRVRRAASTGSASISPTIFRCPRWPTRPA